jgi:hypothetical protein
MNLQGQSKAIAGGVISALVALGAHFGFQPDGQALTVLSVAVTVVVGYVVGHVGVYFSPANKVSYSGK